MDTAFGSNLCMPGRRALPRRAPILPLNAILPCTRAKYHRRWVTDRLALAIVTCVAASRGERPEFHGAMPESREEARACALSAYPLILRQKPERRAVESLQKQAADHQNGMTSTESKAQSLAFAFCASAITAAGAERCRAAGPDRQSPPRRSQTRRPRPAN